MVWKVERKEEGRGQLSLCTWFWTSGGLTVLSFFPLPLGAGLASGPGGRLLLTVKEALALPLPSGDYGVIGKMHPKPSGTNTKETVEGLEGGVGGQAGKSWPQPGTLMKSCHVLKACAPGII